MSPPLHLLEPEAEAEPELEPEPEPTDIRGAIIVDLSSLSSTAATGTTMNHSMVSCSVR